MSHTSLAALRRLARLYNVQTQYYDIFGQLREPDPASVTRILQVLGAAIDKLDDAPDALRERRQGLWNRCLDKIVVAWEGNLAAVKLRLPVDRADKPIDYQIRLESGECRSGAARLDAQTAATKEIGGVRYLRAGLALDRALPLGYHRLRLEIDHEDLEALVIAAPARAYEDPAPQRSWGIFVPLYALHSSTSWGAGNYSDLGKALDWVQEQGGRAVGTLPLLPTFLDEPFE
ncbi:MAG: 4-alpha-glucanotransferase, partial [Candidatus Binatia bacterium]